MNIDVITLFSSFFDGPLSCGLVGKAFTSGAATLDTINPRTFTVDRHRTVDDTPYGGGPGMVMKPEPLLASIAEARSRGPGPVVMLTPQGRRLCQLDLQRWASLDHLVLVAGRYEGFDERVREAVDEEISIGDFVLTGGEYGALVVIDGIVRLRPGTVGNFGSTESDSFEGGVLEHPQYTRPESLEGRDVPAVLRTGDHGKIEEWRRQSSLQRTRSRRPDLLEMRTLDPADRARVLETASATPPTAMVVQLDAAQAEASLRTALRLAAAYDLSGLWLVSGDDATRQALVAALEAPLESWRAPRPPRRPRYARERAERLQTLSKAAAAKVMSATRVVASMDEAILEATRTLDRPQVISPCPGPVEAPAPPLDPARPRLVVLGDAAGVATPGPTIRLASPLNDLPWSAVAAITLDRLIGEG